MNAKRAKQIKLTMIMDILGFQKIKEERGGQEYKYLSPFREEKEPSFNINIAKNAWFDFGEGEGGNTLDFAIKYLQSRGRPSQVPEALSWLEQLSGQRDNSESRSRTKPSSFSKQAAQPQPSPEPSQLEFINALRITHPIILSYLRQQRGISESLSQQYLKEIRYKNKKTDKIFFAFGMENRAGGWEVRSASDQYPFKSALNGRDITLLAGTDQKTINVFEGMIDFLSYLTLMKLEESKEDVVIMHSLSSFSRCCILIKEQGYVNVKSFLDNDDAGHRTTELFREKIGGRLDPQNDFYHGFKDINAALIRDHN